MNTPTRYAAATLDMFRATRRRVFDLSTDRSVGGGCSDLPGYVYADQFFIEIEPDGSLYLPIANTEEQAPASDLDRLEAVLFEYAQKEGIDAEQCHLACVAENIACHADCPHCGGAS